jgi:hypothetical protein
MAFFLTSCRKAAKDSESWSGSQWVACRPIISDLATSWRESHPNEGQDEADVKKASQEQPEPPPITLVVKEGGSAIRRDGDANCPINISRVRLFQSSVLNRRLDHVVVNDILFVCRAIDCALSTPSTYRPLADRFLLCRLTVDCRRRLQIAPTQHSSPKCRSRALEFSLRNHIFVDFDGRRAMPCRFDQAILLAHAALSRQLDDLSFCEVKTLDLPKSCLVLLSMGFFPFQSAEYGWFTIAGIFVLFSDPNSIKLTLNLHMFQFSGISPIFFCDTA